MIRYVTLGGNRLSPLSFTVKSAIEKGKIDKSDLDGLFNPKSVAVVGVSTKSKGAGFGGINYLDSLLHCGFKGKIYPVNPKGGEIRSLKVYPNIKDIPEPVDYVISCIPASAALELVRDCAAQGVKGVHFYTSGFSETGTKEGRQLEEEVCSLARQSGIRVIGPNCMGIYHPKGGLAFVSDSSNESGSVGLISQSGGNAIYLIRAAACRGIRFSKAISYGNACDVNESDLLEYLADDPDTKIITAYIEGVKNGQRFRQALNKAASLKPVIVLKVGTSELGAMAAASHTGALSGSDRVWDGLLHQVGTIRVNSLEELIDMAVAFSHLPSPVGRRTAILGVGGGATVLLADDCADAGLVVPRFPEAIRKKLSNLLGSEAGTILNNPVDLSADAWRLGFYNILGILGNHDGIDLIIVHFPFSITSLPPPRAETWEFLLQDVLKASKEVTKPLVLVIHFLAFEEDYKWMLETQRKCCEASIAVYHSIAGAAKAVDRFLRYHDLKHSTN
jgi:acyl-CoA synthetase (NDP forming)